MAWQVLGTGIPSRWPLCHHGRWPHGPRARPSCFHPRPPHHFFAQSATQLRVYPASWVHSNNLPRPLGSAIVNLLLHCPFGPGPHLEFRSLPIPSIYQFNLYLLLGWKEGLVLTSPSFLPCVRFRVKLRALCPAGASSRVPTILLFCNKTKVWPLQMKVSLSASDVHRPTQRCC